MEKFVRPAWLVPMYFFSGWYAARAVSMLKNGKDAT